MTQIETISPLPAQPYTLRPEGAAETGPSFGDLIDAINPLQHIPVVSSVYRAITGSSISTGAQIAGDVLYGGLAGSAVSALAGSVAGAAVEEITGKSAAEHVMDALTPETPPEPVLLVADRNASKESVANPSEATIIEVAQAAQNILHMPADPKKAAGEYYRAHALSGLYQPLAGI